MKKAWAFVLALSLVIACGATSSAQSVDALRARLNQGTIAIMSGGVNGTYIRIASDLATVLDGKNDLRVLPIVGKGSLQNMTDLLYLRGIDFTIVQSDVLSFILKDRLFPNIEQRVRYVTKLYNEEVHILAAADVQQLSDLAGKKVNVDVVGSGTAMTAATLFAALNLQVEPTNFDQALALEKLKAGEVSAMVYVAGKPTDLFRRVDRGTGLHFLQIPLSADLLRIYLPSSLTQADYPALIADEQPIDTVAVGAVMAVYNWEKNTDRYRRTNAFVETFFDNIEAFLKPPRHPKWEEVNLAAEVPGWTRFQPAQEWLDRRPTTQGAGYDLALKASFDDFVRFMQETRPGSGGSQTNEALFARFLEWRSRQQVQQPPAPAPAASPNPAR
jgi:TRAP transporter TAXI family solute receptor